MKKRLILICTLLMIFLLTIPCYAASLGTITFELESGDIDLPCVIQIYNYDTEATLDLTVTEFPASFDVASGTYEINHITDRNGKTVDTTGLADELSLASLAPSGGKFELREGREVVYSLTVKTENTYFFQSEGFIKSVLSAVPFFLAALICYLVYRFKHKKNHVTQYDED